jgi:stress response protein YsnF
VLTKAKTLNSYKLHSIDRRIGNVKEFCFDDHHWTIRYIVADTGDWLTGRQVLISPYALEAVNKAEHSITVGLTKRQIEGSPSLNNDSPISRQFEENYYRYYRWPMYWDGTFMWGYFPTIERDREKWKKSNQDERAWDFQLRSTHEVNNYNIQAADGEIGHIEDFVIDDETWAIRYLIVNTRNSEQEKKVLVSTKWIDRVIGNELGVFLNLSCNAVKQSPEYTDESLLTRDYETKLHRHYNRRGYWIDTPVAKEYSR